MQSFSLSSYNKDLKSWSKPLPVINANNESFRNECIRINTGMIDYINTLNGLTIVNIWNCDMSIEQLHSMLSSKLTKPFTLSHKSKTSDTDGTVTEWYLLTINSSIVSW